jgi:hypothetical protein
MNELCQEINYYESEKWTMVSDLTYNISIVGLEALLIATFEKAVRGKYTDIGVFVESGRFV